MRDVGVAKTVQMQLPGQSDRITVVAEPGVQVRARDAATTLRRKEHVTVGFEQRAHIFEVLLKDLHHPRKDRQDRAAFRRAASRGLAVSHGAGTELVELRCSRRAMKIHSVHAKSLRAA